MTDDLIERLRSVDVSWSETGEWCAEAADRIEALETANEGYNLALAEQLQIRQELEAWKAAEEAHHHMLRQELDRCRASNAVMDNTVASLTAEVERLRGALKTADAWLDRWATHIGNCPGIDRCTCGLTRARYEVSAALAGDSHE